MTRHKILKTIFNQKTPKYNQDDKLLNTLVLFHTFLMNYDGFKLKTRYTYEQWIAYRVYENQIEGTHSTLFFLCHLLLHVHINYVTLFLETVMPSTLKFR